MCPTLPANFAALIAQLCGLIARHGLARGLAGALIIRIWQGVRTAATRVETLFARCQAGTVRRHPNRRQRQPARRRRPAASTTRRKRAWLVVLIPETAGNAAQLQRLLDAPDIPALLHAAPQLRRALRPLCHALGARMPPATGPVSHTTTEAQPSREPVDGPAAGATMARPRRPTWHMRNPDKVRPGRPQTRPERALPE